MNDNTLKVKIRDSENIIFEGDADLITSINELGRFDVLPMHANFISMIQKEIQVFSKKKMVKELTINQAVLKVTGNKVHIFLGLEAFNFAEDSTSVIDRPKTPQANP